MFGLFGRKREAELPSTVSDMMDIIRPIAIEHGVSEAYVSYDSRTDVTIDRPDWIFLSYTMLPGYDISEVERFEKEINRLFGDRVCPVLQHPSDFNIAVARKFYVNLFA